MTVGEASCSQKCLVCAVPITSMHLGMDACRYSFHVFNGLPNSLPLRACSSFFKRTRITGRQYPCRSGNRNCSTLKGMRFSEQRLVMVLSLIRQQPHKPKNTDDKMACRRCRFEKCVVLGMIYDGPIRVRRKTPLSILQRMKIESK